jgi:hypothetical protein
MNSLLVAQPGFFPALDFFLSAMQSDVLILADHLLYQKKTSVTRCTTFENPEHLFAIPVKHSTGHVTVYHKPVDYSDRWLSNLENIHQYYFDDVPFIKTQMNDFFQIAAKENYSLGRWLKHHLQIIFSLLNPGLQILSSTEAGFLADHTETILYWLNKFNCNRFIPVSDFTDEQFIDYKRLSPFVDTTHNSVQTKNISSIEYLKTYSILSFFKQYGLESGLILRQNL